MFIFPKFKKRFHFLWKRFLLHIRLLIFHKDLFRFFDLS